MQTDPVIPSGASTAVPGPWAVRVMMLGFLAFLVGLPFVIGRMNQEPPRWYVPHGLAFGVFLLGVGISLVSTFVLHRWAIRRVTVGQTEPPAPPIELPRSVRRAVLRRGAVPEEWAPRVVPWLDHWRTQLPVLWLLALTQLGMHTEMTAMADYQRVMPYLLFAGMFAVIFAVMAAISRKLALMRRYYAASG